MKSLPYKLGDVVRWWYGTSIVNREPDYFYGMMVEDPEMIRGGKYYYNKAPPADEPAMVSLQTTVAITVFSFKEQRVITLYQSPEEPPLGIELVNSFGDS